MEKQLAQNKEFRTIFKMGVNVSPTLIPKDRLDLHGKLLLEEVNEFIEAAKIGDLVGMADALTDIAVIKDGALNELGLAGCAVLLYDEVHASNMSKLDEKGEPIFREDGKVLKGPNYFKPKLEPIVEAAKASILTITKDTNLNDFPENQRDTIKSHLEDYESITFNTLTGAIYEAVTNDGEKISSYEV